MQNNLIFTLFAIAFLISGVAVSAQSVNRKSPDPTKYNLDSYEEKLKKISIRSEFGDGLNKKDSSKYRFAQDENITIRVLAEVSDQRIIGLGYGINYWIIPVLFGKDAAALSYSITAQEKVKEKQEEIERRKNPTAMFRDSGPGIFISPNRENSIYRINIVDWYGKLAPGRYKFMVNFSFAKDGNQNRIESQPVVFEIY